MKKALKMIFMITALCLIALTACEQGETPEPEKEYKIGDVGPAGGIIFYDKGDKSGGWRYLEAAPADLRVVNGVPTVDKDAEGYDAAPAGYLFGYYRKTADESNLFVNGTTTYSASDCTGITIGTGKKNTELLVKAMGNSAYKNGSGEEKVEEYAAKLCSDLVFNGFNDWFLPSNEELNLMYVNLCKASMGNFAENPYWTSSEYSDDVECAWSQDFLNSYRTYTYRYWELPHIRPARAF